MPTAPSQYHQQAMQQHKAAHRARRARELWARVAWWLMAGLPTLAVAVLLIMEQYHLPDVSSRFDVSDILTELAGGATAFSGLAIAVAAIGRTRGFMKKAHRAVPSRALKRMRRKATSLIALGMMLFIGGVTVVIIELLYPP